MVSHAPLALGEAVFLITGDRRGLTAAFIASRAEAGSFFGTMTRLGVAAFLSLGAAAVAGIGASINMAKNLEFAISAAGAVGEATVEQLEQMHALAISLSKESIYGATEIAQAMEILFKAGTDVETALAGAAKSVIILAQAGGTSLDTAADIIATSLTVFNGSAADTEDWINRIAAASNKSRFDVEGLSAAIGQGAAAAELVGISFEDFMAYVGLTAASFNSASQSGTTFKVFLQRLNPVSKLAQKELQRVGIITDELGNQFFNANGEIKDMAGIIDVLRAAYADMTPEDTIKSLTQVFGTRGYKAAAALIGLTSEEFLAFKELSGNTSAEEIAAERLDNLQGSFLKLRRTIEGAMIGIGDWFSANLNLQGGVEGLTKTLGRMFIAFEEGFTGIENWRQRGDFGPWVAGAKEAGRILREDITPALKDFGKWISESALPAIKNFGEEALPILKDFAIWMRDHLIPVLWDLAKHDIWPKLELVGRFFVDELVPAVKSLADELRPLFSFLVEHKGTITTLVLGFLAFKTALAIGGVVAGAIAFLAALKLAFLATGSVIAVFGLVTGIALGPVTLLALAIGALVLAGILLWKNWETVVGWADKYKWVLVALLVPIGLVIAIMGGLVLAGIELYQNWDKIKETATNVWNSVKGTFSSMVDTVKGWWNGLKSATSEAWNSIKTFIADAWQGAINAVKDKWNNDLRPFFTSLPGLILALLVSLPLLLVKSGKELLQGMASGAREAWGTARTWFQNLPAMIKGAVGNLGSTLYQAGKDVLQGFINGIDSMAGAVGNAIKGAVTGGISAGLSALGISSPSTVFHEMGVQSGQGFINGIRASESGLARVTAEVFNKVPEWVQNAIMASGRLPFIGRMVGDQVARGIAASAATVARVTAELFNAVPSWVQNQIMADNRAPDLNNLGTIGTTTEPDWLAQLNQTERILLGLPLMGNGGIVPGIRGSEQLILAHAGETVLPTHKMGSGSGVTNVPIYLGGRLLTNIWFDGATGAVQQGLAPAGILNR